MGNIKVNTNTNATDQDVNINVIGKDLMKLKEHETKYRKKIINIDSELNSLFVNFMSNDITGDDKVIMCEKYNTLLTERINLDEAISIVQAYYLQSIENIDANKLTRLGKFMHKLNLKKMRKKLKELLVLEEEEKSEEIK